MKTYNGHRSWNAWNVSLWMGNDESMYRFAMECIENAGRNAGKAARHFIAAIGHGTKTPDGAIYNHLSVKLALEGFIED